MTSTTIVPQGGAEKCIRRARSAPVREKVHMPVIREAAGGAASVSEGLEASRA
jgi:hypothetical protein